jgi:hypothetical protein
MAVMMFALILTTAAAPRPRWESQREKEEEMFWRGQQVAWAIKRYRAFRGGAFPTDLNELVEGVDLGGKKIRLLRPSALCDPMTPCVGGETNWRLVHPGDPLPKELLDGIIATQEKRELPINPQSLQELARFAQMGATKLPGQPADTQLDGVIGPNENQGADSNGDTNKGPIIGVVSRKKGKMFRSYYSIEEYDHALFFADVPVIVGGFVNLMALSPAIIEGKGRHCPNGGLYIESANPPGCFGGLLPGQLCRGPKGETVYCSELSK